MWSDGDTGGDKERLLGAAILGDGDGIGARRHDDVGGESFERGGRRVLELDGDRGAALGQLVQGVGIVVLGDEVVIGHHSGGRIGVGFEHDDPVTHGACSQREVAAELTTAEHTEHGRRLDHHAAHGAGGKVAAATSAVISARYASRRSRSASSPTASSATANNAALVAPASPMANVATGTPAGICTIECRESTPARCFDATGTPSTGTVVLAASMPGRWAAPPAPAMMQVSPRRRALAAYSNMASGVRCADTTCASYGTANRSSTATARDIVAQSLVEPITTPIIVSILAPSRRGSGQSGASCICNYVRRPALRAGDKIAPMRRLLPDAMEPIDPDEAYADPSRRRHATRPWLLLNMIESLDGGTIVSGRSGGLGGPGDKAIFFALRRLADVVLVGAATVHAEGYHAPKKAGQRIAVVTRSGDLDWSSDLFRSDAAVVITIEGAPEMPVPTIRTGVGDVDLADALRQIDADIVLCEGGPTLNGPLMLSGLVDEICLTIAPTAIAGSSKRIIIESREVFVPMRLAQLLEEDGYLFCRYLRE